MILVKVIGRNVDAVTFLQNKVVISFNILELRVGLEVWCEKADWAHVGR